MDRYLEALLARRPADVPDVPAELLAAAVTLAAELPRFHPSFRFEERLAARLARGDGPVAGELVAFPSRDPASAASIRPVVIGGVLTSAALSLAGAAFLAWRRTHPTPDAMTRAIRAVARTRAV